MRKCEHLHPTFNRDAVGFEPWLRLSVAFVLRNKGPRKFIILYKPLLFYSENAYDTELDWAICLSRRFNFGYRPFQYLRMMINSTMAIYIYYGKCVELVR